MRGRWVFEHLDRINDRLPTPEQYAAVAELLEDRAVDGVELKALRQMFGLERTPAPRAHPGRVTHGCAVGVAWHEEQQVPECIHCRRWRIARTVHGTEQSCQAHYQDGEQLCEVCQAFYDERHHTGRRRLPFGDGCGSSAGFRRHIRLGEPVCGPCRDADRIHARENRLLREQAARAQANPQVDGTDTDAAHAGEPMGVGKVDPSLGTADSGEDGGARSGHVRQRRRVARTAVGAAAGHGAGLVGQAHAEPDQHAA